MADEPRSIYNNMKIAELYKAAQQTTEPFATLMIRKAGLDHFDQTPLVVLDNACGTGVISAQLYEMLDESVKDEMQLVCGDNSERMVEYVKQKIQDDGWKGAKAEIVDAQKTGLPSEHFTHVITSFGIMTMPDPTAALNECFRMLKPGGICAWSTWENNGWIEDIRAAFATLPGPPPFPDTKTFMESWGKGEWYRTAYVEEQLVAHGFVDVKVESVPNTSTFGSPAEFCEVFSLMTGLITSKYWSAEERESCGGLIKPALLKYMTGKYGEGKPIDTHWVAILATARKPLR